MNRAKIWKVPQLPEIEFFKAQYSDFAYPPHFHEEYAIGIVEHGVHAFYYRGEHHAVAPGNIVTCHPGEIHTGQPGDETIWGYRVLYLHPTLVQQIAAELHYHATPLPFLNPTALTHPRMVQTLRTLHQQSEQQSLTLAQEVQVREILALMLVNFSEIKLKLDPIHDEETPITRAKEYMQEHYADDLHLDTLAKVAQLSKSYFIRAFRHHAGLAPHAYLIQIRLNRAKTLLAKGLSPIQAALDTGFYDQSHFTRSFKQFLGITPGHYQKAVG